MQIAKVQESLARKALYQPNTRFDDLFSLVAHPYWLWVATEGILQSSSAEMAGIDGITKEHIKGDTHNYAHALAADLKAGTYKPQPVKRLCIQKADGTFRPLGLSTLRDRVVQEAIRMVLEPILESHFLNCSTGFRPGRRAMDAIHLIEYFTSNKVKMWWVVQGHIEECFDTIPHSKLKGVLEQYVQDKKLLRLLASFLVAGLLEKGNVATPNRGVSQAGMLSPLLVNAYLHEFDKIWWKRYGSLTEGQKTYRRSKGLGNVQLVRYADDFVALTNGNKTFAHELREEICEVVKELGVKLSDEKTAVSHLNDGFDFLGFHLQRVHSTLSNKNIVLVKPTQQNIDQFKEAVRTITARETVGDDVPNKVRALNALVRKWTDYYRFVNVYDEFSELERFVHMRMYYWLKAKHSNLSARESVGKYVLNTYLTQYTATRKTWGLHGVKLIPMTAIERKRYLIKWPKERNPYLEYGTSQMRVTDEIPVSDSNLRILCEPCHVKTYSGSKGSGPIP